MQDPDTHKKREQAAGGGELAAEDQVRANTYGLLGSLLAQPPNEEAIELLRQIDIQESVHSTAMTAAWHALSLAARRASPPALDDEYHALFIGIGRGELVPYASWYLTGFMMERPLAQLREDLMRLGIARQEDVKEPEDHAAALCETMSLVITQTSALGPHEQKSFFINHIEPWMARFFADLQHAESATFYAAVGAMGEQFLDVDKRYLDMLPH
jgi:TorA maturation chaperone TorD